MRRFDLDQLVMLVLVLATAFAVALGVASVQEEGIEPRGLDRRSGGSMEW